MTKRPESGSFQGRVYSASSVQVECTSRKSSETHGNSDGMLQRQSQTGLDAINQKIGDRDNRLAEIKTDKYNPMSTRQERAKSVVARKVGEASEDGDFVALRAIRETRKADLPDAEALMAEILQQPADSNAPTTILPRPQTGKHRKRGTVAGDSLWADLVEAVSSGPVAFRQVLVKVASSISLSSSNLRSPANGMNILHFALDHGDQEIVKAVIERADEDLILSSFEVDVMKTIGKKNTLHQTVEQNNIALLSLLLGKISSPEKRIKLLNQEVQVEIKGQRPRTFPCLHLAAYFGFTEIVTFILKQGVDVNHLNAKKDSALLWAARWGHGGTVRILLQHGALTGLENDKGSTALYWAVRYGHTETVDLLAREGKANVEQTRKLGFVAPIVLACALGYDKIVSILLEFKANPNFAIRGGERPIHHAAREGHAGIIELLIEHDAEVDAADERGDTALLLAAKHGQAKALNTLLKQGANASHKNLMGEDVWIFAVSNDNDLILKLLVLHQRTLALEQQDDLDSGPINLTATSGVNSLLFLAADVGNAERIRLLLKMKIDASVTDEDGNNFLHHAAMKNQAHIISEFHKEVNIDVGNNSGDTALHEACIRGHHEAVVALIKVKAMANIRNSRGETALHLAAFSKLIQPHTVSKLMDYVIKTHPWECLNITDNEGNNPLHIAAKHARPEILWEFRFVRFKDSDADGNIALHEAVRPGEPDVLDMMLDIYDAMKRDCDINHKNHKLETCLFLAASEGFLDGVKRLMLFGADISAANERGNTPLHMLTMLTVTKPAMKSRCLETIGAILEKAPAWYCTAQNIKLSEHKPRQMRIRRQAILHLISKLHNVEDLSVLDLACKVGASDVIKLLVTMEDVMAFKMGKFIRYDITNITPRTNGTVGGMCVKAKISPRPSCLEWLLANGNSTPLNAAKVLDFQPFRNIEIAYGSVAAWAYAFIMIIHILYMSLFSWAGLTLLDESRISPGERRTDAPTLVTYILVPLEPALILMYNMYKLVALACMGELSVRSKLSAGSAGTIAVTFLSVLVAVIYSIFVLIWIITYATHSDYKDYFLAIALCLGWLFTIAFTRGFKVINYFWRLIQIMIVRDVFKFLFIYLFVLLAFSFAFHALFQVSATLAEMYPNPAHTIFMMFNMMIGMVYVFEDNTVTDNLIASDRDEVFPKVLYLLYIILATIVLLNLLIAMMNDSYQEILKRQRVSWRIESVQLGVDVEKSIPLTFPMFSKVRVIRGFICPEDKENGTQRWYVDVYGTAGLSASHGSAEDEEQEALLELKSKVVTLETRMSEQIQGLKNNVDEVQSVLKKLEKSLVPPEKEN